MRSEMSSLDELMTVGDETPFVRTATNFFGSCKAVAGLALTAVLANGAVGFVSASFADQHQVLKTANVDGYNHAQIVDTDVVTVGFFGCDKLDVVKYTLSVYDENDQAAREIVCRDLFGRNVLH